MNSSKTWQQSVTVQKLLVVAFLVLSVWTPSWAEEKPSEAFFRLLRDLNGKQFAGSMVFPDNRPDHPMNKPMRLHFQVVSESEIRVPFAVGDDHSRTWILQLLPEGLQLKHDHRLADGSPDPVTMYGGIALAGGMSRAQMFPADEATVKMLPEARTNCWMLWLSPDGKTLVYSLERDRQARFQANFDLSKPLP